MLFYWVFILSVTAVFGLKVFKQNLTQSFFYSVFGILALMVGALCVNIMYNLSLISENVGAPLSRVDEKALYKRPLVWGVAISLPLIAVLLFLGDLRTSDLKERHLVESSKHLVQKNMSDLKILADFSFDQAYVEATSKKLRVLSKIDESFPNLSVIVKDNIDGKSVFLNFGSWDKWHDDRSKVDFMYSGSADERRYLDRALSGSTTDYLFSASDGKYELYYPLKTDHGVIVLYFTDRRSYGKLGS